MLDNKLWRAFLGDELTKEYFLDLEKFLLQEYQLKNIFPSYTNLFRVFNLVAPNDVKVVIIGQDPYHAPNQANGLAFSVSKDIKIPPSLVNIFKELCDDIGCEYPQHGDLTTWAEQGVFLINSVLSVEESSPNSHKGKGWEVFTDTVITKLSKECSNIVFVLWGKPSQQKESLIDIKKHLVLKAPHPSPLSAYRCFFGSKPFSKINRYFKEHKLQPINWCLNKP